MELANRVSPTDRLDLCERFRELAAQAICHRHAGAVWLAKVRPEDLDSAHLVELVMELDAWISEQPPLDVHPDSYQARQEARQAIAADPNGGDEWA